MERSPEEIEQLLDGALEMIDELQVRVIELENWKNGTPEKPKAKPTGTKKIPPDIEDVKKYCKERGNDVDPQKWFDFYEAKGWFIGKNKMKSWQAAVRTWENNSQSTKVDNEFSKKFGDAREG